MVIGLPMSDWCLIHLSFSCFILFRLTLLLGPPSSGKTTLLLALAGRLGRGLEVQLAWLLNETWQSVFSILYENYSEKFIFTKCKWRDIK